MAVQSEGFTELGDEFELVPQTAAEAGVADAGARGAPRPPGLGQRPGRRARQRGVLGRRSPELVLLHDSGESARTWDAVALALGRPSVAIDLPGHGRSDWRRDGRYEPASLASAVAEAIRSFAPRARLVAGTGLGGLTALALRRRHARLLPGLALVNTLPGAAPGRAWKRSGPELYASRAEALAALAARRPESSRQALRREVLYELLQDPDGSWAWRHHPGNLPAEPDRELTSGADPLWGELAQLQIPVTLIRSDWAGPLAASDLAIVRQQVPQIRLITIPGAGVDIAATQPAALAAALDHLLATDQVRQ